MRSGNVVRRSVCLPIAGVLQNWIVVPLFFKKDAAGSLLYPLFSNPFRKLWFKRWWWILVLLQLLLLLEYLIFVPLFIHIANKHVNHALKAFIEQGTPLPLPTVRASGYIVPHLLRDTRLNLLDLPRIKELGFRIRDLSDDGFEVTIDKRAFSVPSFLALAQLQDFTLSVQDGSLDSMLDINFDALKLTDNNLRFRVKFVNFEALRTYTRTSVRAMLSSQPGSIPIRTILQPSVRIPGITIALNSNIYSDLPTGKGSPFFSSRPATATAHTSERVLRIAGRTLKFASQYLPDLSFSQVRINTTSFQVQAGLNMLFDADVAINLGNVCGVLTMNDLSFLTVSTSIDLHQGLSKLDIQSNLDIQHFDRTLVQHFLDHSTEAARIRVRGVPCNSRSFMNEMLAMVDFDIDLDAARTAKTILGLLPEIVFADMGNLTVQDLASDYFASMAKKMAAKSRANLV